MLALLLLPERHFPDNPGDVALHFFNPQAQAEDNIKEQDNGDVKEDVNAGGGKA